MHPWLFALFCLFGLFLFFLWGIGIYGLVTLRGSDNKLYDGLVCGFIILFGGYLLSQWLIGFLLTAPFYIPFV